MNKIKTKVSREANFIYHMLSVSECGYSNEYSREYSSKHMANDLKILKDNEKFITVSGGEHCGEIYWLFVAIPASLDTNAFAYYSLLNNLFATRDVENNVETYRDLYMIFLHNDLEKVKAMVKDTLKSYNHLKSQIVSMSEVMMRNYSIYCNEIWEKSKQKLLIYSNDIQQMFENGSVSKKLESITHESLKFDFIASFCNSIDGGAEAIDISENQDIFGIGRTYGWAEKFISHEYVIYLLKQALSGTTAFSDLKYWKITESLAEFYLSIVLGETGAFVKEQHIIDFYKTEYNNNSHITSSELYRKAAEIFV